MSMLPVIADAHFSFLPHSHHVVQVYGSFPEQAGPWTIREYCNGTSLPGTFTHRDSFEAKNGWNIDIGFAAGVVSAAVRFDVNGSHYEGHTYQQPIAPMVCIQLSRTDMYRVTWFLGMTSSFVGNDFGYGFAGRYLYPSYSTSQRSMLESV
jgi:hypothetical protein